MTDPWPIKQAKWSSEIWLVITVLVNHWSAINHSLMMTRVLTHSNRKCKISHTQQKPANTHTHTHTGGVESGLLRTHYWVLPWKPHTGMDTHTQARARAHTYTHTHTHTHNVIIRSDIKRQYLSGRLEEPSVCHMDSLGLSINFTHFCMCMYLRAWVFDLAIEYGMWMRETEAQNK